MPSGNANSFTSSPSLWCFSSHDFYSQFVKYEQSPSRIGAPFWSIPSLDNYVTQSFLVVNYSLVFCYGRCETEVGITDEALEFSHGRINFWWRNGSIFICFGSIFIFDVVGRDGDGVATTIGSLERDTKLLFHLNQPLLAHPSSHQPSQSIH